MPLFGQRPVTGHQHLGTERASQHQSRLTRPAPQAVILAAGEGSRLRADAEDDPKPLIPVAGISLLERALLACRAAGVSEVVVVVGYRRAELLPVLARLRARLGIRVTPAICPQWALGNGASALAAEPYVKGPFLLTMCDHIVEPTFFQRLAEADDGARACAVVVDRETDAIPDIDEATKVRLQGRWVTAIGKGLTVYDAVDTGVFLCRRPLFDALREAATSGRHGLSDGVRLLAQRGEVGAVDGTGLDWFDVDTPADLDRAEQRLSTAQFAGSRLPAPLMLPTPAVRREAIDGVGR